MFVVYLVMFVVYLVMLVVYLVLLVVYLLMLVVYPVAVLGFEKWVSFCGAMIIFVRMYEKIFA